jgi:hypothetical protein
MNTRSYWLNRWVHTPYGLGRVVQVNDAYGVKVRYDSGNHDWHQFAYVSVR